MNKDLLQPLPLCHLQKRIQVGIVAVDAAIRQKAVQVQLAVMLLHLIHRLQQDFILKKVSILNRLGDSGQILIDDPSGSHIEMANLRIAHLPVRKADIKPAGLTLHKRILLHQPVHHGSLCQRNRIVVFSRIQSVAVKDHQNRRSFAHISSSPSLHCQYTRMIVAI